MADKNSILDKLKYVAVVIVALLLLFFLGKIYYDLTLYRDDVNKSVVEMKRLSDDITRSQSQYVNKSDLKNFANQLDINLNAIKKDLDSLNARLQGISSLLIVTPGTIVREIPGKNEKPPAGENEKNIYTVECPNGSLEDCPDPFGYLSKIQILDLNEPFNDKKKVPFGQVKFKTWNKNPWDLEVYPRSYAVVTVLGQDEDGRHFTYNKFSIKTKGKEYPIEISESKFVETYPESQFYFSPRLYLGVDVGAHVYPEPKAEVHPNLQVSLFSYGRTKIDPTWTFLGVGAGFESQEAKFGVILSPVNYNVGKHIPLVNNLHIGPSVAVDTSGSVSVMGGLRVGL